MDKSLLEKLSILLPHWIEHNRSHAAEFAAWAAKASGEGLSAQAMEAFEEVSRKMHAVEHCLEDLGRVLGIEASLRHGAEGSHHHHSHGT